MIRSAIQSGRSLNRLLVLGAAWFALFADISARDSWQEAAREAERLIAQSRRLGGEAAAQKAHQVLAPWWQAERLPHRIRLQRATLLQREHDFAEALNDLNAILREDPHSPQAWLMKSTILTVNGRFEDARKAAVPLFALASPLTATTAGTAATASSGHLEVSYRRLKQALRDHPKEARAVRAWALTSLAEMAERLGLVSEADQHFRDALLLDSSSPYLLRTYSSFLIGAGDPSKAYDLLYPHREELAVPWMLAFKEKSGINKELSAFMTKYEKNWKLKNQYGHSHGREEAAYFLYLKNDPREALHQAIGNWEEQKEAADLLILFRAALAAEDEVTLAAASAWVEQHHFEDQRLFPLMEAAARLSHN